MKTRLMIGIIFSVMILILVGCQAPSCYPPNKIIGKNCCMDDNANGQCDYDEPKEQAQTEKETPAVEEQAPVETEKPKIVTKPAIEEKPAVQFGKSKIETWEPKKYLTLDKLSAYRTSRDRALLDYMEITVRNIGAKKLNPVVEILFEGARYEEHVVRIKKEYILEPIAPGEKLFLNQSLGISLEGINLTKKLTVSVYERYSAPREDLEVMTKNIVPQEYMESLEIFTYGPPTLD